MPTSFDHQPQPDPPSESRGATADSRRGWHSPSDWLRWFGRTTKRLLVLALGVAIVGAGLAMLVLPGPGVLIIIVGLAVLATEFMWAERALDRATSEAATAANRVAASRRGRLALMASGLGMITGGALVAATVDSYRVIGISLAAAGLIGLGTLLPSVQRWLESKTSTPSPSDRTDRTDGTDTADATSLPASAPTTNGDTR